MKKAVMLLIVSSLVMVSCGEQAANPFFRDWETPFRTPPFDQIQEKHYLPALEEGMQEHNAEIRAIATNPADPTFQNTVEALEYSGELLDKVANVFYNLASAQTSDAIQKISREVAPLLSRHEDNILLNTRLFQRVKAVYDQREDLDLSTEQQMLLKEYYEDFVRGGANLSEEQKAELRDINQQLSVLSVRFSENLLEETNAFELVIDDPADLAGLPENVISAAAETAEDHDQPGKWVFTVQKPSMIPFLQYSSKRDLRERIFKAYINRGDNDNAQDNKEIVAQLAGLRVKKAHLLGYPTFAHYILDDRMAKTPAKVYELMDRLWKPALRRAKREAADLQAMIDREGGDFKLQPWDWWYYAEKLKKEKYAMDDEVLRPYFVLENVRQGAFDVAHKLYGLSFLERTDIPTYNPDVKVFEVLDADGSHLGILYADYFPRENKRGGAWMNSYRKQYVRDGDAMTPIVTNVFNFSKPTGEKPALLSFEEAQTMFHEFGHALHGLLSKCTYPRLSGTSVPRDFVELPSQIMENWAADPAVLKSYARHYQTGQPIPDELIQKIRQARLFNQGFATVEYLAAAYLDMDWHTLEEVPATIDVDAFEQAALDKIGLIPEIVVRYRSTYFQHVFVNSYYAGYYSYVWAEVLDADAFEAFKEHGLFDPNTARAFRENILERGGTEDPMVLYKRFRGAEPDIRPLLDRRGLTAGTI